MSLTQNVSVPILLEIQFSLLRISLIGSDNITVSNNRKYPKGYLRLGGSCTITLQLYNSTILLTWLVNTCVSICKKESTHRLKLQFLVFLNPLMLSDFCIP